MLKDYKKELKEIERIPVFFLKKHFWSIILTVIIIWIIFLKIDFQETASYLAKVPTFFILIAFLLNLAMYALWVFRWRLIIQKISKIRYFILFPIFFAGGLINQLTPGSKSGGQPLRAYYLNKINKKDFADNFATTIFEFLSGSFVSLALLVISLVYLFDSLSIELYYSIIALVVLSILAVLSLIYLAYKLEKKSKFALKILKLIYIIKPIKNRFKTFTAFEKNTLKEVREFFKETIIFLDDKPLLFKQMLIELLTYLIEFFKVYILFKALGIDAPFVLIAGVSVVSQMIGFLGFSPGGLGMVEGSAIGLFYLFGIDPEIAAAITILNRIILYFYEFVCGYISLLYLRQKYQ